MLERRLHGGGRLADLLAPGDTTVVLIYDPADCLSCGSEFARWRRWEAAGRGVLRLVLTRAAVESERAQFRLFRITPAGSLEPAGSAPGEPRVFRFAGPVLIDSAAGAAAQHRLLEQAGF